MTSSPNPRGTILVIGSGPGIGVHIASLFSLRGFKQVILLSRNNERLLQDADSITSATYIHTVTADTADTASLKKGLAKVEQKIGDIPLECVLFNAARVGESEFFEWAVEQLEHDFKIAVTGCYTTAEWAIPLLEKLASSSSSAKPTFLVTSGLIYQSPVPQYFSLACCKAAQHNLVNSLHQAYKEKGIHCCLVVVGGKVADDAPSLNPKNIADHAWRIFEQGRDGDLDVVMYE